MKAMKNKISLKMWLSVFFGGIGQFFRTVFSWKNKTPFWRVIWATLTVCIVIFTVALVFEIYRENARENRWVQSEKISERMLFTRHEYSDGPGWVNDANTGEVITRGVDWIIVSEDEDSLAVFSSKGKRGYLNRYSGEIAIAPQFEKAWVFSSGLAAVVKDGKLFFIDHSGKPVNDKTFVFKPRNSYVYHGDYCVMNNETDMLGLIDRNGDWKVEPTYDVISRAAHDYWKMRKGDRYTGLWYAYTDKGERVNETGVLYLEITDELGVIFTQPDHLKWAVDFDGNESNVFLCQELEPMYYDTDSRDSTGCIIQARCTLYRYRMDDGYEGLCREDGEIVTGPLYWNVRPIGRDLYHCTYKDSEVGVIINSKGEITKNK